MRRSEAAEQPTGSTVIEYPCKMRGRDPRIGDDWIWYSYSDASHTVGVSLPPGRVLRGETIVDEEQVTIRLFDPSGEPLYVDDRFDPPQVVVAHAVTIPKAG